MGRQVEQLKPVSRCDKKRYAATSAKDTILSTRRVLGSTTKSLRTPGTDSHSMACLQVTVDLRPSISGHLWLLAVLASILRLAWIVCNLQSSSGKFAQMSSEAHLQKATAFCRNHN